MPDELDFADASDLLDMAVMMKRIVPAEKWVAEWIEASDAESFRALM